MAPFSFRRAVANSASQKDKQGEDQTSLPLVSRQESSLPEIPINHNVFYGCFDADGTITTSINPAGTIPMPMTASFSSEAPTADSTASSTHTDADESNTGNTTSIPRLSIHHATFTAKVSAACFHCEPPGTEPERRGSSKSNLGHGLLRGRRSRQSISSNSNRNNDSNPGTQQMLYSQFKEVVYLCAKYTDDVLRCWTNATIHGRCVAPECTNQARAVVHRAICASPGGYCSLPKGEEMLRLMHTIARQVRELQGSNGARARRAIGAEVLMKNHLLHQRHARDTPQDGKGPGFVNVLASPVCDADGPCGEKVKMQLERFIQLAMSASEVERGAGSDGGRGGGSELLKHSFGTSSSRSAYTGAGSSFSTMKSTTTAAAASFELYGDDSDTVNDEENDPDAGSDAEAGFDDDDDEIGFDDTSNIIPELRSERAEDEAPGGFAQHDFAPRQTDAFDSSPSLPSIPPRGPQLKSDTSLLRYAAYIGRPSIDPLEDPHPQTLSHLVYVSTWPAAFLAHTGQDIAASEISMFEKIAAYHESFIMSALQFTCAICSHQQRATTFLHRPISFRRCARSSTTSATGQNIPDDTLKSTIFNFQRYVRGPQRWTYPEIIATLGGTESHSSLYCMVTGSGMDRPLPHVNDFLVPLCARNTLCEETARIAAAMFVEKQVPVQMCDLEGGGGIDHDIRLFPPLSIDTGLADEMCMTYGVEQDEEAPRCVVKRVGKGVLGPLPVEHLRAVGSASSPPGKEVAPVPSQEHVVTVHDLRACLERSEEWSDVRKWVFEATGTQIMAVDEDGDADDNSAWETSSSMASESHSHEGLVSSPSSSSSSSPSYDPKSSSSSSSSDSEEEDFDETSVIPRTTTPPSDPSDLARRQEAEYIDDRVYTYTLREPPGRTPFTEASMTPTMSATTTTTTPSSPQQANNKPQPQRSNTAPISTLKSATRTAATTTTWGGYPLSERSVNFLLCGAHEIRIIEPVLSIALMKIMEWGFLKRQMDMGAYEGALVHGSNSSSEGSMVSDNGESKGEREDDEDRVSQEGRKVEEVEKEETPDEENQENVAKGKQEFRNGQEKGALSGLGISLS